MFALALLVVSLNYFLFVQLDNQMSIESVETPLSSYAIEQKYAQHPIVISSSSGGSSSTSSSSPSSAPPAASPPPLGSEPIKVIGDLYSFNQTES